MAEGSDVLRARRIEVVDEQDRVRVELGMIGIGEGEIFGIVLHDPSGRARAWMVHDGPSAEFGLDHGGNTIASLSVDDGGEPHLFLDHPEAPEVP